MDEMCQGHGMPGMQPRHASCAIVFVIVLSVWISLSTVFAETPAPGIHWGALGYPDQEATLTTGLSIFRFTEFNKEGERFNDIKETIGLNLITMSWTEHWTNHLPGWSTNLTVGVGPTRNQPSEWLQNDLIHDRIWGIPQVPVEEKRHQTDFAISGSVTRWWGLLEQPRVLYLSGGGQTGSLYHEAFIRGGFRRWSPLHTFVQMVKPVEGWVGAFVRPFRVSGMVRAGRIATGAAFHDLADTVYTAQGSISYGWYNVHTFRPWMEIEVGATIGSGIFNDDKGVSLGEQFWTVAFRIHPFTFESWNDQLGNKDFGPTYGGRLMMDLYFLLPASWTGS